MTLSNDFLLVCSLTLIGLSLLQAGLGFTFGILFARWRNNRAEAERLFRTRTLVAISPRQGLAVSAEESGLEALVPPGATYSVSLSALTSAHASALGLNVYAQSVRK